MSEPRRLKGIAKGRKRKKEDPFPLSIDGSGAAHIFSIARFSARFPCRRSQVNDTPPRGAGAPPFSPHPTAQYQRGYSLQRREYPLWNPKTVGACPPLRQSDSRAPSSAPIAPLPRKRLAFSATGGASALSPLTLELQILSHFSAPVHQRFSSDDSTYFSFRCRSLCTVMFPSATPFAAGMHLVRKLT